ncbi:MAG TPA: hypothetical protein VD905_04605 [Flavobacteriales bacterium]|nr:hypothetical protein [Flavobacteriales bacterium]
MKYIILFLYFLPLRLCAQDSLMNAIDKEINDIDEKIGKNKFGMDTVTKIEEEYEQRYIVAFYEKKNLRKVSVSTSDGAAGDISGTTRYYFKDGELIFIVAVKSYFMAGGCGETGKIYFNKANFARLITETDCRGEKAAELRMYLGDYTFDLKRIWEEYQLDTVDAFRKKN